MEKFLNVVEYKRQSKFDDDILEKEPRLTQNEMKKIKRIFKTINLNDTYVSICDMCCGCEHTTHIGFWTRLEFGMIRLEALDFLIKEKLIDFQDQEIGESFVKVFIKLLSFSGTSNSSERTVEYMFNLFENELKYMLNWSSNNGDSLLNAANSGHSLKRNKYSKRFMNMGAELLFIYDNTYELIPDELVSVKLGYSPLFTAIIRGSPSNLKRMLKFSNVKEHLESYSCDFYIYKPLILNVLEDISDQNNPDFLQEYAIMIKMVIDSGYNTSLIAYNVNGKNANISDYLEYYGFNYKGSPILECFTEELPTGVGNPGHFKEKSKIMEEYYDQDSLAYMKICEKYKYLKDSSKFNVIISELDSLLNSGISKDKVNWNDYRNMPSIVKEWFKK